MAYETPLTIAEVMKGISSNKYVLPSIQREYVWDTSQIETLFDSLMQGYPIGAFLFWEIGNDKIEQYQFYEFLKDYHELNSVHNKKLDMKGNEGVTAVLDGQQRLTSIYIGLKGTYAYRARYKRKDDVDSYPARKLYLNLISTAESETNVYDFQFLTDEEVKESKESNQKHWFEVGRILNMSEIGEAFTYIQENISYADVEFTKEQAMFATKTLPLLFNTVHSSPTISYYREKSEELDKVLNIFIRVNSGGTVLTYSDLLLSIASAQWESYDAREEITSFVESINTIGDGFRINKDFVLKTALVLSDFSNIAFKVDNFDKKNTAIIEENWDTIKKSINMAVSLVSSFGYNGETLSSNNALIPIAYYLMKIGLPGNFVSSGNTKENREKIKKWLIMSLLKKAFSGQPDNVLRPIREIIRENGTNDFPIEKIIDRFKGTNKSIQFNDEDLDEYLLKLRYNQRETLSTLMLLYPSLDFSNKFHEDHMYPKSKFNKKYLISKGVPENKIDEYIYRVNEISNLQLLAAQLNEEKLATDFDVWFNQHNSTEGDKIQYRTIHMLPEMDYSYDDFLSFLDKRRELLKNALANILIN